MANAVEKVNTIAITDIQAINGITDDNLQALNGLEFTGTLPDAHTLISTHDIAVLGASATIDITSGITDTYDAYEFRFTNMHPANDSVDFLFQVNAVDLTGFNEVMTTTNFRAVHNESDSATNLGYDTNDDQAQTQLYQSIANYQGFDNDQAVSGVLTLYAPSSTTYVKHFTSRVNAIASNDYVNDSFAAGYINVTAAIDEISFKFSAGNIQAGQIKMYGIAKA